MKKMNILIIGSDLNVRGGMVSVIKNYINYNKWRKCRITYIPCYIEKGFLPMILFFMKSLLKIRKSIKENSVDIAHLHMAERGSFFRKALILKLCKRHRVKVIIHHHGAEFGEFYQSSNIFIKKYIRRILTAANLNIVLSNRLAKQLHEISPEARVKVLYNAVTTYEKNQYQPTASEVLFLGRLGERKGIYDLLQVIKELDERLPKEIRFNLCGDGEVDNVLKKSDEYGIRHRLGYVGWMDSAKKEEILPKTMLNVLPSYNEGLPMSILETMAYGIPNISTNIASIPEVIHNAGNGYLIEPGNQKALSSCLETLVGNQELRRKMSREAYKTIKQTFSIDRHIDRLEQYYEMIKV